MSKEIANTQGNQVAQPVKNIQQLLQSDVVKGRLAEILGKRASTFATAVIQISNSSELLKKAEPTSLLNAALLATTLDLPLNNSLGQAYLVPFNNKQKDGTYRVEAQFQLGAKGIQQLAIRSGQYLELESKEVYEGQVVEDDSFIGYHFEWRAKTSEKIIGYAAYFKLISGFSTTFYMSIKEIEDHAKKYSQTYKKGFGNWKDDFDKMARKTVMKLLLNSGKAPLSIEMRNAITADQSVVKGYDGDTIDVDYVDNTPPQDKIEVSTENKELERLKEHMANITTTEELNTFEKEQTFSEEEAKVLDARRKELAKPKK